MIKAQTLIEKFYISLNEGWGYIYGMKHVIWTQTRQDNYVKAYAGGESVRQNSVKYGGKWIGHIVTDCSGMFAYWLEQLKEKCAHGSNSIYDNYCKNKGTLKNGRKLNGEELKPGTAVFPTDANGKHNHIGLYVGNGEVIEAYGALKGVIKTPITDKRWKAWGELKMIDLDGSAEDPPWEDDKKEDRVNYPTIRKGAKNEYVKKAQQILLDRGYNLGRWGADGDFGQATEAAVKAFQKDNGLTADGIIGPKTWGKLLEDGPKNDPQADPSYRVIIKGLDYAQAKALANNYPGSELEEE